ncbi:MAG: hypothetical protein ACNA8K_00655 [Cyclonatronaceae bacterium]
MRTSQAIALMLLIVCLQEPAPAQTLTNGQILADIGAQKLLESDVWEATGGRLILQADLPSPLKARLVSGLIYSGREISLDEGVGERIRLEWTTTNRLTRIDRLTAKRELTGSLTIYHLSDELTVLDSEVVPFTYQDEVDAEKSEELAGNWQAERFRVIEMEKRPGLWRRIAEPAVVIAATGVTIFLLYNVRSQ